MNRTSPVYVLVPLRSSTQLAYSGPFELVHWGLNRHPGKGIWKALVAAIERPPTLRPLGPRARTERCETVSRAAQRIFPVVIILASERPISLENAFICTQLTDVPIPTWGWTTISDCQMISAVFTSEALRPTPRACPTPGSAGQATSTRVPPRYRLSRSAQGASCKRKQR